MWKKKKVAREDLYFSDFETTGEVNYAVEGYVRVHAWCLEDSKGQSKFGNDIDSWFKTVTALRNNSIVYFHNLAFDISFIEAYLLDLEDIDVVEKIPYQQVEKTTYSVLRSNMGIVYSAKIKTTYGTTIELRDSLKLYPITIDALGKTFGIKKLTEYYDYKKFRPFGEALTGMSKEYLKHDVDIMRVAVLAQFDDCIKRGVPFGLTRSSIAFAELKKLYMEEHCMFSEEEFYADFPKTTLAQRTLMQRAYAGGIVFSRPATIGAGSVFDVNSEYPAAMQNELFPKGEPIVFRGKYLKNKEYPLYIQKLSCKFKLKKETKDFLPIPVLPKTQGVNRSPIVDNDHLAARYGTTLVLTNVDLKWFFYYYDVTDITYLGGLMFEAVKAPFKSFIDAKAKEKIAAEKAGDKAGRLMAKLSMNGCYGKFAQKIVQLSQLPVKNKKGTISQEVQPAPVDPDPQQYFPMAVFIASWARNTLLTGASKAKQRVMYIDTDSIHVRGKEPIEGLDVDQTRLGAWKQESTFDNAHYLRDKTYAEEENNELTIKAAGLQQSSKNHIKDIAELEFGVMYPGALYKTTVKGGCLLREDGKSLTRRDPIKVKLNIKLAKETRALYSKGVAVDAVDELENLEKIYGEKA